MLARILSTTLTNAATISWLFLCFASLWIPQIQLKLSTSNFSIFFQFFHSLVWLHNFFLVSVTNFFSRFRPPNSPLPFSITAPPFTTENKLKSRKIETSQRWQNLVKRSQIWPQLERANKTNNNKILFHFVTHTWQVENRASLTSAGDGKCKKSSVNETMEN